MKIGIVILVFFAVFNLVNFKKKVSLNNSEEKIKLENLYNLNKKGEFKIYYENGQISTIGNYNDFKLNGSYVSFYENGAVASDGFYKMGFLMVNGNFILRMAFLKK